MSCIFLNIVSLLLHIYSNLQLYHIFRKKYQNSFWVSVWLNLKRSFVLWKRDRIFIRASIIKNVAMGLSVGFVFLNTDMVSSFFGVLFQGNLFIMLGAVSAYISKASIASSLLFCTDNMISVFMLYLDDKCSWQVGRQSSVLQA